MGLLPTRVYIHRLSIVSIGSLRSVVLRPVITRNELKTRSPSVPENSLEYFTSEPSLCPHVFRLPPSMLSSSRTCDEAKQSITCELDGLTGVHPHIRRERELGFFAFTIFPCKESIVPCSQLFLTDGVWWWQLGASTNATIPPLARKSCHMQRGPIGLINTTLLPLFFPATFFYFPCLKASFVV